MEPRRPRPLQPRREPEGRRGALRLPRHLHLGPLRPRQGPAPSARAGAARVRGRGEARPPALAPPARAARRRGVPLAAGDGRRGRDLPPAALHAARGLPGPERRAAARGGGRRRPHAGLLARPAAAAPAGHGHRGRQGPVRPRRGRAPRLPHRAWRSTASRSARARSRGSSRRTDGLALVRGPVGRGRPRPAAADARRAAAGGAAGRGGRGQLRRGDADAGRGPRRGRGRSGGAPIPTGRVSWPGPGSRETLEGLRQPGGPRARGARRARSRTTLRPYQQAGRALALPPATGSASAPAWPTTWASARRSRCWRSCAC